MATNSETGEAAITFSIDTQEHGYPDGPDYVYVELTGRPDGAMAILAAGAAARYSFDFTIDVSGIELTRAYIEGMRGPVDVLPTWVAPIQERIETEVGVGPA